MTSPILADGSVTPSKLQAGIQTAINLPGDLVVSCAAARAGCLLCDGSAVSRSQYAALFAAVGTTYGSGAGDGVTFSLPDFRQRVIMGAGAVGGDSSRPTSAPAGPGRRHRVDRAERGRDACTRPRHQRGRDGRLCQRSRPQPFARPQRRQFAAGDHRRRGQRRQWRSIVVPYVLTTAPSNWGYLTGVNGSGTGIVFEDPGHAHSMGNAGGSTPHANVPPFGVANVFIKTCRRHPLRRHLRVPEQLQRRRVSEGRPPGHHRAHFPTARGRTTSCRARRDAIRAQSFAAVGCCYLKPSIDPAEQARGGFIATVPTLARNEVPAILDLEERFRQPDGSGARFFDVVQTEWAGFECSLYGGASFLQNQLSGAARAGQATAMDRQLSEQLLTLAVLRSSRPARTGGSTATGPPSRVSVAAWTALSSTTRQRTSLPRATARKRARARAP